MLRDSFAAGDRDRPQTGGGRAVAERTEGIDAPAVGPVARGHATRMADDLARAHLEEAQPAGDRHRPQTVGIRAVAELAMDIETPAVGPVVRGHAAGVAAVRAHLAKPELAGDRERPLTVDRRAIAEPALEVEAPAVGPGGQGSRRRCGSRPRPPGGT